MSIPKGYRRVTNSNRCPICGKNSWCLVSLDQTKAICPRVPSEINCGEAGFLHTLNGEAIVYKPFKEERPVTIDAEAMHRQHQDAMTYIDIEPLSVSLGVSCGSLWTLGVGKAVNWCDGTYSFPMRDATGKVIGIHLRNSEGKKWCVYGSQLGLFYDPIAHQAERIFVCEGVSDAATLLDMDFTPIGRPSNTAGLNYLKTMIRATRPDVVITAELDGKGGERNLMNNPGEVGAELCAEALLGIAKSVRIIAPLKGKDMREWKKLGATRNTVLSVVQNTPEWRRK